jgi:tetratricopeptide (TPR) repeat protein
MGLLIGSMGIKQKSIRIAALGFIGLVVLSLGAIVVLRLPYTSKIPRLPESVNPSPPVRDQISEARAKARRFPSAENLGMLGMVYHSSANYAQAAQCYQLAVKRDSSAWIWNYYLAYLNLEMGDAEEVITNFTSVVEKNPAANHAWYYLGEQYRNLRRNLLAEQSFTKIMGIQAHPSPGKEMIRYDYFPLGTYAMYQLARLYVDSDRLELAAETLETIIQHQRSFGPAYRLMSNVYRLEGDTGLSKTYGIRANDLVVLSPPVDTLVDRLVLLSRSELYLLKKIDEAEKSIYPEWALRLVNHALQYMPDNPYLLSKAIRICLMSGQDEQASSLIDQHLDHYRDNFTEMNNMGILFFQKRMYPQSMKYLTRALELKPQDPEILKSLAVAYWTMGEQQKSREIMDGMALDHWNDPDVLAGLATLRFDLGEPEKAMAYLSRLKQILPEHPQVQKLMGVMAEKEGHVQKAIAWYESFLKRDPEDMSTTRNLTNLLIRQQMWDRTISHLRTALEHHPNDPYLLERLGTLLVTCPDPALRNTQEGRYFSERAFIHTDSRSLTLVSAGRSLALAYAELGDQQNAWNIINMTLNVARGNQISPPQVKELQSIARRIQAL